MAQSTAHSARRDGFGLRNGNKSVAETPPSDVRQVTETPNPQTQKDIPGLLALVPFVRCACELDLLVFFYRHGCSLLTNEQLAALVGYNTQEIAVAIAKFTEVGILERVQNPTHNACMYRLVLECQQAGELKALLDLTCQHQGRQDILHLLTPRRFGPSAGPAERSLHFVS